MKIQGHFVLKTATANKFDPDAGKTAYLTVQTDGSPSINMITELNEAYGSDAWQGFIYTQPDGQVRYNIKA